MVCCRWHGRKMMACCCCCCCVELDGAPHCALCARSQSLVVVGWRVHVWIVRIQLALVDVVPDVIPGPAPIIPADDAAANHEAVEAGRTLQKDLVDAGRVECPEEPIRRVLARSVVLVPVVNPLGLVVARGAEASATRLGSKEWSPQQAVASQHLRERSLTTSS